MHVVTGLLSPLPELASPVATLGAFDGVHRGHQQVLRATVDWAAELDGSTLVVTFDPLPKAVVGPGDAACITSLPHRLLLLERCGVDLAIVLAFDQALQAMAAEEFVRRVLLGWLGARHLVLGRNSTFGHRGAGNLELLQRLEADGVLQVRSPQPVVHGARVVSSTAIRQAIAGGDLAAAAAMLGRPFSLLGAVVPGDGRGRSLGFPTANLDLHHEAVPPNGVYATTVDLDGRPYPALTYIGSRPTFESPAAPPIAEVHLIGFDGDLYGRDLEVAFLRRLRDDVRFPSAAALIVQMKADRRAALDAYNAANPPP